MWSGSMHKVHIVQELQAVALMLHKMAFWLSCKGVALHLDRSSTKAYLSNQGDTVGLFLSRLAFHIWNLTNRHGITLYSSIHTYPCKIWKPTISWGQLVPEWHLLPHIAQAACHLWGQPEMGSAGILTYQSMSAL